MNRAGGSNLSRRPDTIFLGTQETHLFMNVARTSQRTRKRTSAGWLSTLALAAAAGISGCSQSDSLPKLQVYEVKGQVVLADGKPLKTGVVSFVSADGLPVTPMRISQRMERSRSSRAGRARERLPVNTKSGLKRRNFDRTPKPRDLPFRPSTPTKTVRKS